MMLKSYPLTKAALLFIFAASMTACESDESSPATEEMTISETGNTTNDQARAKQVENIFYTIPSPIEMASLIKKSGADFDEKLLNPVENASNYTMASKQALNLGVYGADLSYTSIFDQNQSSIFYLSAAQKLAKELGVENAIDNRTFERINNNMENRDSLLHIVSDAFWSLNGYLKEDGREDISALVIAGGWIEGLYLAGSHLSDGDDKLKTRIAEQKYSLDNLLDLMKTYEDSDALVSVIADFENIKTSYDGIEIKKSKTETSKDEKGTMIIGGKREILMTDEQLHEITGKIAAIRASYIQ